MYVRDQSRVKSTIIDKKFDLKLMDKNALKKTSIENFSFSLVDINVAYNLMFDDLKSKSGLIYPDLFLTISSAAAKTEFYQSAFTEGTAIVFSDRKIDPSCRKMKHLRK